MLANKEKILDQTQAQAYADDVVLMSRMIGNARESLLILKTP